MMRIGITGGIGSGKSTVANLFAILGIPVYFADEEAKKLMNTDPFLKGAITMLFGEEAYSGNQLNRSFIAAQAFSNPEKLAKLNELVHPAVIAHGEQWMAKQQSPFVLKEAALIFESGSNKQLDYVIGVWCPRELRIERVMQRDGSSRSQVLLRMEKQMDEEEKMQLCDFVIKNDETNAVIPQVLSLHRQLVLKA